MGAHFAKVRVVVPSSLAVACAIAVTVNRPSSPSREEGDDNATCAALNEGAKTSNRLADDQGVHLSRTLIRVDCFRIGNEPTDVVLEQDAVPAQQFAGVADRLAALDRTERLCERGVLVLHRPLVLQLRQAQHHRLRGGDIAKHPYQQVLDKLESSDRLAELVTLRRVAQ